MRSLNFFFGLILCFSMGSLPSFAYNTHGQLLPFSDTTATPKPIPTGRRASMVSLGVSMAAAPLSVIALYSGLSGDHDFYGVYGFFGLLGLVAVIAGGVGLSQNAARRKRLGLSKIDPTFRHNRARSIWGILLGVGVMTVSILGILFSGGVIGF